MNKILSGFIRLTGLGIAALFLWGCGKMSEPVPSDVQPAEEQIENNVLPEGYAWSVRFQYAGSETNMHHMLHLTQLMGNSLYYHYRTYDKNLSKIVTYACIQEEGKDSRQLDLPAPDGMLLRTMTIGNDDCLYLLYEKMAEDGQLPTYTLEKRNTQLQAVYSMNVTADLKAAAKSLDDLSNSTIYYMAVDYEGNLYGLAPSGMLVCWDAAGSWQGSFTLPKDITTAMAQDKICFGLANAGASGVYAYWGSVEENTHGSKSEDKIPRLCLYDLKKWMKMDEAERKGAKPLEVNFSSSPESMPLFVFSGYEDGLYMTDQNRLWQIDLTDGSIEPLLVWQDLTLKAEYVTEIRRQPEGGFVLYVFDTLEQVNYWVHLTPIPAEQLPEKTELVLGIAGRLWGDESLLSRIDQVVLSYNRTHPYSHITIKEYDEDDVTNFQLELLNGTGPDILMEPESLFDMEALMSKGAVEDLAPYLTGGDKQSDENILPGILRLITKDGKIPRIPLSFSAGIMVLPRDRPNEVMTPQEMAEFMAGDDGTYIDCMVWPRYFLPQILFGAEMDRYVDAESKSCSFDSEEFVSLLEQLAKLGDMRMVMKQEERFEPIRSGQLMAVVDKLSCLEDYLCIRSSFYDTWEITGFPNSQREVRYPAFFYDWLGINSASEYKEEAWGFIEFCLSYASRADDVQHRFSVTKDKFSRQTRYENKDEPLYHATLNHFLENHDDFPTFEPTTQEETEFLREISEHLYLYENQSLRRIISEESSAFFAGDISAREAADRIQNRASLLLNE